MHPVPKSKRQKGTVLVLITAGIVGLAGAAALSVDVGYFFVMRNQLQNAVDAATLAGAQGLIADPGNFSSDGQAKRLAIQIAALNRAGGQSVSLSASEITFPDGNTVRVQITRPATSFFARVFGVSSVNIQVAAQAVVTPVTGVGGPNGGMRPWSLVDQFGHGALCVPPNDDVVNSPPHGPFNSNPHDWKIGGVTYHVNSDSYKSPYDSSFDGWDLSREGDCGSVTGFIAPRDVNGTQMTLKQSSWLTPGNFGAVALGGNGASNYRSNIINGYSGTVRVGDVLTTEPGNMVGPTRQGVDGLIAQDPDAHIVRNGSGNWEVVSGRFPINESPRIVPIPMYSVFTAPGNGRSTFTVTSIVSFFIEGSDGKTVWGRFIQSRSKNGQAGKPPTNGGSRSVGGGGRLVATVRLVDVTN